MSRQSPNGTYWKKRAKLLEEALRGVRCCAAIEAINSSAWADVVKELDRVLKGEPRDIPQEPR